MGFHNQGHFVRFLFYAILSCGTCLALLMARMLEILNVAAHIPTEELQMQEQEVLFIDESGGSGIGSGEFMC